ncbi:aminohydrolase ssna-related [Anaeramoeba flamelloides]|uniref:Aminohydrolase ssna-related n=1 Tax=Anaeramoeba flamelloides TaxID=1746091 RepID=A0ABQ8XES8_9EUKA|nr:aminohydrolase ssna-related [Anaeramoeba flamelloides]
MTLLYNAVLFTGTDFIVPGALYFEKDTIVAVGGSEDLFSLYSEKASEKMDLDGKLLMPGMICLHGHFYGMFSRGMSLKGGNPSNFKEILEQLWWRLDKALQPEDVKYSALVCLLQAIKCGTTTIVDHHASPNSIKGSLDEIASATLESQVRAVLCYEVTDRNGEEGALEGIKENIRFIKKCLIDEPNPLLGATFGLHAAFTCCDETLTKCRDAMLELPKEVQKMTGFHIHVGEDTTDLKVSMEKYGIKTVERLKKFGILGENSLLGHCVDVDKEELQIIKDTNSNIVHNPQSNMNNAVGLPDVLTAIDMGIDVGLGTDGITLDMFAESKVTYFSHKLYKKDPRVMGGETLKMLIEGNSKIASKFLSKKVGSLEPGAFADCIIVDYDPPTDLNKGNFPWHVQFGVTAGDVRSTICGGKWLMKDRKILTLNEKEIMKRARELSVGVWDRF